MSCCSGRRPLFQELISLPSAQQAQTQVEQAMSGAEKVGMALAVGSVLAQIFFAPKKAKSRKSRRRS